MTIAAVAVYAVSWLLPTLNGSGDPSVARINSLPGWKAFLFVIAVGTEALSKSGGLAEKGLALYGVASGLTNAVFVGAAAARPFKREWSAARIRTVSVALWACTALNAIWMAIAGRELRPGYYVWLASFALLGVGCYQTKERSLSG